MASSSLKRECEQAAARARSMRITGFAYSLDGDVVTLDGNALTPDAIDSAIKLFTATTARSVKSRMRHVPPDPANPGALYSSPGYVEIVNLGPHASRLAETLTWEVKDGDTLASIALQVYGDAAHADRILLANRNQIGEDRHVHGGQRLRLPPR